MGKMIVTAGNYSKKPYLLKNTKLGIHSIEELCYCMIKNPELCEDFLYDRELANFMGTELGLKDRAVILAECIERDAPVRDLATVIFCSCDYLVREEIEDFIKELAGTEKGEAWRRVKNKADRYLKLENFKNAIINYRSLIKDAAELRIPDKDMGDIYHNLGVALLSTEGLGEAAECFRMAYDKNHRKESLTSYLLALRFADMNFEYEDAMRTYNVSRDTDLQLQKTVTETVAEFMGSGDLDAVSDAEKLLWSGKISEFYGAVGRLTGEIKEKYIRNNE